MRAVTCIYLYEKDEKFFGQGPYMLLKTIEATGSLRSAAKQMNLSYSKAMKMIHRAEDILGYSLTEKVIGGKGGGGSHLSEKAKQFLNTYEAYREACYEANQKLYSKFFQE